MAYPSFARARHVGRRSIGGAATVSVFGLAAAVALAALILLVPILAELLANGGCITVPAADSKLIDEWKVVPVSVDAQAAHYEHCGLLPTVWQARQSIAGPLLRGMYRSCGLLHNNQGCLLAIVGCLWTLAVLAGVLLYGLERWAHYAAVRIAGALQAQIHGQAHRLGAGDLFIGQKLTAGTLFFEKTAVVRRALVGWWYVFPHAACFAVLMLALALSVDFWLALTTILLAGFSWRLFALLRKGVRHRAALLADRAGNIEGALREQLQQNRLLGNLTMEDRVDSTVFHEDLRRSEAIALTRAAAASSVGPLVMLCVLLVAGFVLLLAGFNVLRDPPRLSFSGIVFLSSSLMATAYPLFCIERLLEQLPEAEQAAEEILTYLDREPRVGQLPDAVPLERLSRQMMLEHVTLADMAGRLLLDHVSMVLPAGQSVVLFCSDDSTPLALAGLLSRFCDPAAGQVFYDGHDLRQATLESVRRQVTLILPDHLLVSGTVAENIVGDPSRVTSDEILAAARLVHAYEFIQSLPQGLETLVGPLGVALSAGQAIRLGLARVALRRPSVVVIEEPREDLDQITAERVADALERVAQGRTLVILARRLATLRAAPRILLFHEGRLLAEGTHLELLQHNDLYRHLNYVRFNEFRDKLR
ncbi:MAG TPA: ABC transporter ATP-binding protein [Pirellulales bacterium]|nr:ABC transporter ATP-binding protein [Pirellulales bacterium]